MRVFYLRRTDGVIVGEGVEFTYGPVALRWYGNPSNTTIFDGLDDLIDTYANGKRAYNVEVVGTYHG